MSIACRFFVFILLFWWGISLHHTLRAADQIWNYEALPTQENNFGEAHFACLLPSAPAKSILVLLGGTDCDARPRLGDPHWKALAETAHCALVAVYFRGAGEAYEVAPGGSGAALLEAIEDFARVSGEAKLRELPLILYGHSAGAQFAFSFALWKPDCIRAIVCLKSGPLAADLVHTRPRFPALFVVGEKDQGGRVREAACAFRAGRLHRAPWSFAFQPQAGHDTQGCGPLIDAFILALNGEDPPRWASRNLLTHALTSGPIDHSITSSVAAAEEKSWQPAGAFEQMWLRFSKPVRLQTLLTRPNDLMSEDLHFTPILPLPTKAEVAAGPLDFTYEVASADHREIKACTVHSSNPAVDAQVESAGHDVWKIVGHFSPADLALGTHKLSLDVQIEPQHGDSLKGELVMCISVAGEISASPASAYLGALERDQTTDCTFEIRGKKPHPKLSVRVSDPAFCQVKLTSDASETHWLAKCSIRAGTRIGSRVERLEFTDAADPSLKLIVPLYIFVRK